MASEATTKHRLPNSLLMLSLLFNAAAAVLYIFKSKYTLQAIWAATQRNPVGRELAGLADIIAAVGFACSILATILCLIALRLRPPHGSSRWTVYILIVSLIILVLPVVIMV